MEYKVCTITYRNNVKYDSWRILNFQISWYQAVGIALFEHGIQGMGYNYNENPANTWT